MMKGSTGEGQRAILVRDEKNTRIDAVLRSEGAGGKQWALRIRFAAGETVTRGLDRLKICRVQWKLLSRRGRFISP